MIFKSTFEYNLFSSFILHFVLCRPPADNIPLFQVPFAVEVSLVDGDSGAIVSCFGINGNVVA
jgi:hypothetical protein